MTMWTRQTFGDDLIVPGQRIGGFILGRTAAEILPEGSSATIADWSSRYNVGVELSPQTRLTDLSTGHGKYHTEEGFKVGTEWNTVTGTWGEPSEIYPVEGDGMFDFRATYGDRGIDFAVNEGRVLYIGVFAVETLQ